MTKDFARPYQNVPYFGIWAEESADDYGKRDAATVLRDAVMRCVEEDMRTPEVFAALEYLARHGAPKATAKNFRAALDLEHPMGRWAAARATYEVMRVAFKTE